MTAILGILNKTAVALAADSAATLTGSKGEKIYNNAHKLFNLSEHSPVGLMVCNSGELIGLPWEIVIKMYRKQLKKKFDKLPDYTSDLITYLQGNMPEQFDVLDRNLSIVILAVDLVNYCFQKVIESWQSNAPPADADLNAVLNSSVREHFIPALQQEFMRTELINEESTYSFDEFTNEYGEVIHEHLPKFVKEKVNNNFQIEDSTINDVLLLIYVYSQHQAEFDYTGSWSGLVIAGFGNSDLFPQLVSYRLGPVFGGIIRAVPERQVKISSTKPSSIEPFAQTDVIDTFWSGIDPFIVDATVDSMAEVVDNVVKQVLGVVQDDRKEEVNQWLLDSKPEIIRDLRSRLDLVAKTKNRTPMLDAVATLSKEDLADMAESLISLTYLKRRASFSSESVGGPVDVAVITKGEGFIWLKRKQYFRPELNLAYISSVFNRSALGNNHPTQTEITS